MVWRDRLNHAGYRLCVTTLRDHAGIALPGLTVQFEVRAPVRTVDCLLLFTIFRSTKLARQRVYQLEVCPPGKRSHRGQDGSSLFGPHEHWGEAGFKLDSDGLSCADWDACAAEFLRRMPIANLHFTPP